MNDETVLAIAKHIGRQLDALSFCDTEGFGTTSVVALLVYTGKQLGAVGGLPHSQAPGWAACKCWSRTKCRM